MKKIQLSLDINEAHRMIAMLTLGHIVTNSESLLVVKQRSSASRRCPKLSSTLRFSD
jgi:hypothetical protein